MYCTILNEPLRKIKNRKHHFDVPGYFVEWGGNMSNFYVEDLEKFDNCFLK